MKNNSLSIHIECGNMFLPDFNANVTFFQFCFDTAGRDKSNNSKSHCVPLQL